MLYCSSALSMLFSALLISGRVSKACSYTASAAGITSPEMVSSAGTSPVTSNSALMSSCNRFFSWRLKFSTCVPLFTTSYCALPSCASSCARSALDICPSL